MPPALECEKKIFSKNLMDRLCIKVKELENRNLSDLEFSINHKTGVLGMDLTQGHLHKTNNSMNCIEPVQPCLPPSVDWTWGLLHDSTSETYERTMDSDFSQVFGGGLKKFNDYKYNQNKLDDCRSENENDRIIFYNNRNLLMSECNERNAEVDKLIAKFDANVEDIWKTSPEADYLRNFKYQTLFSQNLFPNPIIQFGSNLIWTFEEKKSEGDAPAHCWATEEIFEEESSFCCPRKRSPLLKSRSRSGCDALPGAFGPADAVGQRRTGTNADLKSYCDGMASKSMKSKGESRSVGPEEEDLLTSAKTHFRPIPAEEIVGSQTGTYADGTTFVIPNDLEKVSFKRSESGALYLEVDADTPRKYMEFKEKEAGSNNKGDCESDVSSVEEFVPKFRVRQNNEKCCQTDEFIDEQVVPSLNKSDGDSTSYESEEDEFYFPGDDELAQNIINVVDEETERDKNEMNLDHYREYSDGSTDIPEMSLYKMTEAKESNCSCGKNWIRDACEDRSTEQEWRAIWNSDVACDRCKTNFNQLSRKDEFRFREELTQEGEQLLMDLSSMQQMYSNSDWCDDDSTSASDLNEEEGRPEGMALRDKGSWWTCLVTNDEPEKNHFESRPFGKEDKFLSNLAPNEKETNENMERSPAADLSRTERRRRNSSSQKACNLYLEGGCRRPHCRFAHCDSAIPCPFFADASCTKGESCPLSHATRRPLSL